MPPIAATPLDIIAHIPLQTSLFISLFLCMRSTTLSGDTTPYVRYPFVAFAMASSMALTPTNIRSAKLTTGRNKGRGRVSLNSDISKWVHVR